MKKKVSVIGLGNRGTEYMGFLKSFHSSKVQIHALCDIRQQALDDFAPQYSIPKERQFLSTEEFFSQGVISDALIISTQDASHYEITKQAILTGYKLILLEKPVSGVKEEYVELRDLARENNALIIVCHVLRYSNYYSKIKEIISSGQIGDIVTINHTENVGYFHFAHSYVRGNWRDEFTSTPSLLAKCCHDTDLMCWLNSHTGPINVSSFGSRNLYTPENAPKDSTEYCYNCPRKDECLFNAYDFELKKDFCPQYTWLEMGKSIPEITEEEKREYLKTNVFGKCVYKTDMDIVDRQCVSVEFKNGSIATLNMIGGTTIAGRNIHIVGDRGELVGAVEENKFTLYKYFNCEKEHHLREQKVVYDLDKLFSLEGDGQSMEGHYGGDYFIMKDLLALLRGDNSSLSTTDINDSIKGHLICYAAEIARKENIIPRVFIFRLCLFLCFALQCIV